MISFIINSLIYFHTTVTESFISCRYFFNSNDFSCYTFKTSIFMLFVYFFLVSTTSCDINRTSFFIIPFNYYLLISIMLTPLSLFS